MESMEWKNIDWTPWGPWLQKLIALSKPGNVFCTIAHLVRLGNFGFWHPFLVHRRNRTVKRNSCECMSLDWSIQEFWTNTRRAWLFLVSIDFSCCLSWCHSPSMRTFASTDLQAIVVYSTLHERLRTRLLWRLFGLRYGFLPCGFCWFFSIPPIFACNPTFAAVRLTVTSDQKHCATNNYGLKSRDWIPWFLTGLLPSRSLGHSVLLGLRAFNHTKTVRSTNCRGMSPESGSGTPFE